MEEIKNRIITISGEPASGKSTVVKKLTKKYQDMGISVHIISVGTLFREMQVQEYNKMFPEKATSTLADIQADPEFKTKLFQIDKLIDHEIEKKGLEINSKERPNDIYIVDSRLAWKNIPCSYSVRLTVSDDIAGKRVFNDSKRGAEDKYSTLSQAIEQTKGRKKLEIDRYNQKYDVDITDPDNYDLIIDTSYADINELADIIINGEKNYYLPSRGYYPKTWASPSAFLPLQSGRTTGGMSCSGYTIESLAENIRKDGYDLSLGTLEVIERKNIKYLLEGNHRTFAALSTGKTLLPYEITHKDDAIANNISSPSLTESEHYMEYLYDYSDGIRYYGGKIGNIDQFKNFSINDLSYYNEAISAIKSIEI